MGGVLDKRLIFISGKGGVGKSIISSALGLIAAERGKKTLLVGIDSVSQFQRFFQVKEINFDITFLKENLWAINVPRKEVFDNFIRRFVPSQKIAKFILNSPIYQYFVAVVPGIKELLVLARLHSLEISLAPDGKSPLFDLIIVDAPATGHGLSFLEVPDAVLEVAKFGPLHNRAKQIKELFLDYKRTGIVLVTLGEELPVKETIEYYQKIRDKLKMNVLLVIVNNVYPAIFEDTKYERLYQLLKTHGKLEEFIFNHLDQINHNKEFALNIFQNAEFQIKRRALNEQYLKILSNYFANMIIEVPRIYSADEDLNLVRKIANFITFSPIFERGV